jgi:hypothetical protein
MKEVKVGSIVAFKDIKGDREKAGHYRVTSLRGGKVNLGAIFGKNIYYKGIPLEEVIEDEASWYAGWTRTESYMCM